MDDQHQAMEGQEAQQLPSYRISLSTAGIKGQLFINDMFFAQTDAEYQETITSPINKYLFDGKNTFEFHLSDAQDKTHKNSRVAITVEKRNKKDSFEQLTSQTVHPTDKQKKYSFSVDVNEKKLGTLDDFQTIDLNNPAILDSLLKTYETYHTAIISKNIDLVMTFHQFQIQNNVVLDGFDEKQRFQSVKDDFLYSFKNEFLLNRLPYTPKPVAAGKLVTFVYKNDPQQHYITYTNQKVTYTQSYPSYWALDKNNVFFIFR